MVARGRKSLRDQMRENQRALDYYSLLTDRPRIDLGVPEKRERAAPKPSGLPTESQVLQAVLGLVRRHPRVAMAWRVNSGTFTEQNKDGSTRYIRANTQRGMSDIAGVLKDGRSLFIECKSQTGKLQPHQKEFLDKAASAGALVGVCRSVDDAVELLKEA